MRSDRVQSGIYRPIRIIGLLVGSRVLGAGIYCLAKEKRDTGSKEICTVIGVIGGVIVVVCAVLLICA